MSQEGSRIEPEAGKDFRPQDAVVAWGEFLELAIARDEPENTRLSESDDHILADACPFVIVALGVQLDGVRAGGCLNDKLGRTIDIVVHLSGLPALVGEDEQRDSRLHLTLFTQNVRDMRERLYSWRGLLVTGKPMENPDAHPTEWSLLRRREVNNSSNQFRPYPLRHSFITSVEGLLIETIAVFQRRQHRFLPSVEKHELICHQQPLSVTHPANRFHPSRELSCQADFVPRRTTSIQPAIQILHPPSAIFFGRDLRQLDEI